MTRPATTAGLFFGHQEVKHANALLVRIGRRLQGSDFEPVNVS